MTSAMGMPLSSILCTFAAFCPHFNIISRIIRISLSSYLDMPATIRMISGFNPAFPYSWQICLRFSVILLTTSQQIFYRHLLHRVCFICTAFLRYFYAHLRQLAGRCAHRGKVTFQTANPGHQVTGLFSASSHFSFLSKSACQDVMLWLDAGRLLKNCSHAIDSCIPIADWEYQA